MLGNIKRLGSESVGVRPPEEVIWLAVPSTELTRPSEDVATHDGAPVT